MTINQHESVERFARYAKHISDLAAAFHVRLIVERRARPERAAAGTIIVRGQEDVHHSQRERCISIAPVIDETTYAVALHELGHCLHPMGMVSLTHGSLTMRKTKQCSTLADVRLELEEERAAWEWAHQYALEWTPSMTAVERLSYNTYAASARRLGLKERDI